MSASGWRAFYEGDLQGFWGLLAIPALWLLARALLGRPRGGGVEPGAAGFVDAFAVLFALETLLDPIATGPLARAAGGAWPRALGVLFVLLGDFRVLLLVCFLAGGRNALRPALREAALLTPLVPLFAFASTRAAAAGLGHPLPAHALWLVHETAFLGMVAFLRRRIVAAREPARPNPRERYLRAVTAYVAAYYGLWAAADALILAGVEAGFGLRVLPNQLYYALFVPFAHGLFFARSKASTSTSTQASR